MNITETKSREGGYSLLVIYVCMCVCVCGLHVCMYIYNLITAIYVIIVNELNQRDKQTVLLAFHSNAARLHKPGTDPRYSCRTMYKSLASARPPARTHAHTHTHTRAPSSLLSNILTMPVLT